MSNFDDAMEAALDRAEVKITSADETEAPEGSQAVEADDSVHEDVAVEKALRERDSSGKFTRKAAAPKEQEQNSDQEASETEAQEEQEQDAHTSQDQHLDPVPFWSADEMAVLAKAPPQVQKELRDLVARKEAQRNEYSNRLASESERGRAVEKRASEVFEPYKLKLQANGIKDPFMAAERLLAWNEIFEQDPYTAIADLMRKNGLTPQHFIDGAVNEPDPQFENHPTLVEARERAEAAEKQVQEFIAEQNQKAFLSEVNAWKSGVDSQGKPRREFCEMYAHQIDGAAQSIQSQYPHLPLPEVLSHAYDFVREQVNALHGIKPQAPGPTREQVIANSKKAQAAATAQSGGPRSGMVSQRPRLKGKTFEEKLDSALDIAMENGAA